MRWCILFILFSTNEFHRSDLDPFDSLDAAVSLCHEINRNSRVVNRPYRHFVVREDELPNFGFSVPEAGM